MQWRGTVAKARSSVKRKIEKNRKIESAAAVLNEAQEML